MVKVLKTAMKLMVATLQDMKNRDVGLSEAAIDTLREIPTDVQHNPGELPKLIRDWLLDHLEAALREPKGEHTMIEQIVAILQVPYQRNKLSGTVLAQLQKALLDPQERLGLSTMLYEKTTRCFHCGRVLRDGEMTCFVRSDLPYFTCVVCRAPTIQACGVLECDEGINIRGLFKKPHYCTQHRQGRNREAQPENEPEAIQAGPFQGVEGRVLGGELDNVPLRPFRGIERRLWNALEDNQ